MRCRLPSQHKYWTRARVIEGLQRFWRVFNQAPLSSVKVHVLAREYKAGNRNAFPPPNAILAYFKHMYEAWLATGIVEALPHCETCPALIVPDYKPNESRGGGGLRKPKRFCPECQIKSQSAKLKEAWAEGRQRAGIRLRWIATPEIDEEIRLTYQLTRRSSKSARIKALAQRLGWPRWAVSHRARELGLGRVKEPPWSPEELALLEKYAFLTARYIRRRFSEAGFQRSETGIHIMRSRLSLAKETPFYSITQLQKCIGEDQHKIKRWVSFGWLPSRRKETDRTEKQGGDPYLLHDVDVYLFLETHRDEYDIRKCDQEWLLATLINFPRARGLEIEARRREIANGAPSEIPEWSSSKWKQRKDFGKKRGRRTRAASAAAQREAIHER